MSKKRYLPGKILPATSGWPLQVVHLAPGRRGTCCGVETAVGAAFTYLRVLPVRVDVAEDWIRQGLLRAAEVCRECRRQAGLDPPP